MKANFTSVTFKRGGYVEIRGVGQYVDIVGIIIFSTFAQADNPTEVMLPAGGVRVVVGFSPEGSAQKAILI